MVSITLLVIQCIYFFLPGYFANMAPVICKNIPFLKYPIDFGKTLGGKPLFGKNKTFRGLFFGVLFGVIVAFVQFLLYQNNILVGIAIVDYSNWFIIGFLLGLGAILGDLIESFVKRRLNYDPGKPFIPFDQIDFVIGGLILVSFVVFIGIEKIITLLLVSVVLHITVNHIAFYTGVRKEKW